MQNMHLQFERYDSNHVIGQTLLAIRQGSFHGSLLDEDDRSLRGFKRPGILGNRLSDGSYVRRNKHDEVYVVSVMKSVDEVEVIALSASQIAKKMTDGDIVVERGFGHRLREAERELRAALVNDDSASEKMALLPSMTTDRRMPFMGIMIVAAEKGVEIDLETARDLSLKDHHELVGIGRALEKGEWTPSRTAPKP